MVDSHILENIGKYKVIDVLGKGGMGIVYRGLDPDIERDVAIKTIRLDSYVEGPEKEEMLNRVMREARAAGRLDHPNIVTIYDVLRDKDLTFIVMQFVDGQTLQTLIESRKAFSPEEIIAILKPVAEALDLAHANGIIHRDIKPANILIDKSGKPFLADFGVARLGTSTMTSPGTAVGTLSYMSPEQVMGKTVDGRADFFALGVILYELLTGKKPFAGDNLSTIVYKIVHDEPPPLRDAERKLPPGYDKAIRRALAKAPEDRYQSGREMIADLEDPAGIAIASRAFKLRTGIGFEAARKRKRTYVLGGGLLLCVAAAGIVFLILPPTGGRSLTASAPPQAQDPGDLPWEPALPKEAPPLAKILASIEDSFNREKYGDAIRLSESLLSAYPDHEVARDYLDKAKRMQLEAQVAALLQTGKASFQSGDFASSVRTMEEVLGLDKSNKDAQDYLLRADQALSRSEILAMIERHRKAEESWDLNILLNDLDSRTLTAKQQEQYTMLFNIYDRIQSMLESRQVEVFFSGRTQARASFEAALRGRSRADGQWETIVVTRRIWELAKRGTTWKITDIREIN